MKHCPKCNLNYDNTLEFCLEDGTRLVSANAFDSEIPTITHANKPSPTTEKTVSLPYSTPNAAPAPNHQTAAQKVPQTTLIKEKVIEQSNKILETAPIVLALAHNWWQWIYLKNQSYTSFPAYVFSADFMIWLILLALGAALGLLSFKRLQNRGFAAAGLVILAINFILFIVPKR